MMHSSGLDNLDLLDLQRRTCEKFDETAQVGPTLGEIITSVPILLFLIEMSRAIIISKYYTTVICVYEEFLPYA